MNYFLFIIALFSILSCGGNANQTGQCPLGKPSAMFDKNIKGVQGHQFEVKDQNSTETLMLPELSLSLEILQSGCEKVTQEIRITLDGTVKDVKTPQQTGELLADVFMLIYELDQAKLQGFRSLAALVGNNAQKLKFGEQVQVVDNQGTSLLLGVEKIDQPNQTLLVLTMVI